MRTDVTTCHKEIAKVVPEGVVDDSGKLHKVDILVSHFLRANIPVHILWVTPRRFHRNPRVPFHSRDSQTGSSNT